MEIVIMIMSWANYKDHNFKKNDYVYNAYLLIFFYKNTNKQEKNIDYSDKGVACFKLVLNMFP